MIKEFSYTSKTGTRLRKVFVIKENASYIGGIDLSLLPPGDVDQITSMYKDVVPTSDFSSKVTLDGFNPVWARAYRQFSKNKINS